MRALAILIFALCSGLGCVDVSGGAMEARWDLRNEQDGTRIDCPTAGFRAIRFVLKPLAGGVPIAGGVDPCSPEQGDRCLFACDREVGTTSFFIPEGDYSIALGAVAIDGRALDPADGVVVPSPVVRQVRVGQLVDLGVNLVLVRR